MMEVIIIVNGIGKRYEVYPPEGCSDKECEEWLFAELEQSELGIGNKLRNCNLDKLNFICNLKTI